MDEDREIIKDNKDNGNKLNISNKRAELSYNGQGEWGIQVGTGMGISGQGWVQSSEMERGKS